MIQTNHFNAVAMETGVSTGSSRSPSSFAASNSGVMNNSMLLYAPMTPTKTTYESTDPPPVPIKRRIFAVNKQEDNEMSVPYFPSLENDLTQYSPLEMRPVVNDDDEDMILLTPSYSNQSPLPVDMFAIPKLRPMPRREDICHDRLATTDQVLPPLPMLPSLKHENNMEIDCTVQLNYRSSPLPFIACARTA